LKKITIPLIIIIIIILLLLLFYYDRGTKEVQTQSLPSRPATQEKTKKDFGSERKHKYAKLNEPEDEGRKDT
jgi:hypothetical protein